MSIPRFGSHFVRHREPPNPRMRAMFTWAFVILHIASLFIKAALHRLRGKALINKQWFDKYPATKLKKVALCIRILFQIIVALASDYPALIHRIIQARKYLFLRSVIR